MARAKRQTVILHHKTRLMADCSRGETSPVHLKSRARTVDSAVVLKRLPATSALRAEGGEPRSRGGGSMCPTDTSTVENQTAPSVTEDTLNNLSSVILCNLDDVRGERLSNLACFLRENGARCS